MSGWSTQTIPKHKDLSSKRHTNGTITKFSESRRVPTRKRSGMRSENLPSNITPTGTKNPVPKRSSKRSPKRMPSFPIPKNAKSTTTGDLQGSPAFRRKTFSAGSILMKYSEADSASILAVSAEACLTVFSESGENMTTAAPTSGWRLSYRFAK